MKIKDIKIKEIFDSRSNQTIEVELTNWKNRKFSASIPAGKSKSKKEAKTISFKEAFAPLKIIKKQVIGKSIKSISSLDKILIKADNTKDKSRLGGNLMLGVSVSFARALADELKEELWQTLKKEFFKKSSCKKPLIFSNLINGGVHAKNNLDIQEYMIVANSGTKSIKETIKKLISFYKNLGEYLSKIKNINLIPIGDEGGYSINFRNNFEPIEILSRIIAKNRFGNAFRIGIDSAASEFYKMKEYSFNNKKISREQLMAKYLLYFKKIKQFYSIEDPFAENDENGFVEIMPKIKDGLIVGDDITSTNKALIEKYAKMGAINSVIIKPNQIGTVTETCDAINTAHKYKLKTIVSHRSGETEDVFIIQLAKSAGTYGVKIGAPTRERILKFNELIRLYN